MGNNIHLSFVNVFYVVSCEIIIITVKCKYVVVYKLKINLEKTFCRNVTAFKITKTKYDCERESPN